MKTDLMISEGITSLWFFWSVSSPGLDIIAVYHRTVIYYTVCLKLSFKREVFIMDFI